MKRISVSEATSGDFILLGNNSSFFTSGYVVIDSIQQRYDIYTGNPYNVVVTEEDEYDQRDRRSVNASSFCYIESYWRLDKTDNELIKRVKDLKIQQQKFIDENNKKLLKLIKESGLSDSVKVTQSDDSTKMIINFNSPYDEEITEIGNILPTHICD